MATTAPHHCQRPGCKGILRSEASLARGTSEACERKIRQAEELAARRGTWNAKQRAQAMAAVRSGQVNAIGHGLYSVPSSKGDGSRYASDGISCVCHAGAHDKQCWHLLAAVVMDILTASRRSLAKAA